MRNLVLKFILCVFCFTWITGCPNQNQPTGSVNNRTSIRAESLLCEHILLHLGQVGAQKAIGFEMTNITKGPGRNPYNIMFTASHKLNQSELNQVVKYVTSLKSIDGSPRNVAAYYGSTYQEYGNSLYEYVLEWTE
jgi:hypothetical protein